MLGSLARQPPLGQVVRRSSGPEFGWEPVAEAPWPAVELVLHGSDFEPLVQRPESRADRREIPTSWTVGRKVYPALTQRNKQLVVAARN